MTSGNFSSCQVGVTMVRIWGFGVLLFYCGLLQTLWSNQAGVFLKALKLLEHLGL